MFERFIAKLRGIHKTPDPETADLSARPIAVAGSNDVPENALQRIQRIPSLETVADLSTQFIVAAGNNDVPEMKRLRGMGAEINFKADITLGSGTLIFGDGKISQPESPTNALMVALYGGAFDAALYLAQSGADGTYARKDTSSSGEPEQKALDFLLTDCVPETARPTPTTKRGLDAFLNNAFDPVASAEGRRKYETDLFTPEQRVQLFDALVANTASPLDLVSAQTFDNAIEWGRTEIIPKLVSIGVKTGDEHFIKASHPLHRPEKAIETTAAVLPYVKDVNVTGYANENAGHMAAGKADLEAFKRLEEKGLKKDAVAKLNVPTYAHLVARPANSRDEDDLNRRAEFARYLAEQGYPLNYRDTGFNHDTPADVAFREGNYPVGLAYLDAGVEARPEHLAKAIGSRRFNTVSTPQLLDLLDALRERGLFGPDMLRAGFDQIVADARLNDKNISALAPVAAALIREGLVLESSDQPMAQKILGAQPVHQLPAADLKKG